MKCVRKNKLGESYQNKYGSFFEIINYFNANKIEVRISNIMNDGSYKEIIKQTTYNCFKTRHIYSPFDYRIYDLVYKDIPLKGQKEVNFNNLNRSYQKIKQICERIEQDPSYSLHQDWESYYKFKKWYDQNKYSVEGMDIDMVCYKDNIYGPDTCIFVPKRLGCIINRNYNFKKYKGMYYVKMSRFDKIKNIINTNDRELAFRKYKEAKEEYIRELAEYYKDILPKDVYNKLLKYEIKKEDIGGNLICQM